MRSFEALYEKHRESRLVFAIANAPVVPAGIQTHDLAWHRLLTMAHERNALIATQEFYRDECAGDLPPRVERQLAAMALEARHRMQRVELRVRECMDVLSDAGISFTLLKGAAMGLAVYRSMTARPMNDIDILINEPEEAGHARHLLSGKGWATDPSLPGDEAYAGHHHLPPLIDTCGTGCRLELHTSLLPRQNPFHVVPGEIQQDSRTFWLGAAPIRVLSPTHHALHVAIHWVWSHELGPGAWHAIRDTATLFERGMLDLEHFVRTAIRWRARTCAYWTLRLARRVAGLRIHEEVLSQLRPPRPEWLLSRLELHFVRRLFDHPYCCPSLKVTRALWSLAVCPAQSGHAESRPWFMSPKLTEARLRDRSRVSSTAPQRRWRSGMEVANYLLNLFGP